MKISAPIDIDLLEFFRVGRFAGLKLGDSREVVRSKLPEPDSSWDADMQSDGFDIWTYGDIELHFEADELFLIFTDDLGDLNGGKALRLKRWIFDEPDKLSLAFVRRTLSHEKIDCKMQSDALGVLLRLTSGVELTFENVDDAEDLSPDDYQMTSFGLVAENFRRWQS